MPWLKTVPMHERLRFVLTAEEGVFNMSELCERFGVSRKTGYKWLRRYEQGGLAMLEDRSRRPATSPRQTPEHVEWLLVEMRKAKPHWGPRKLIARLREHHPDLQFPSASTTTKLLHRNGLIKTRYRSRPRIQHPGAPSLEAEAPNDVWTADFKGEFRLGNRRYCYPLTIADAHSRYLLACDALASTHQQPAWKVFHRLFRKHGLPLAIRTDNGSPFATRALHGFSRLSIYWTKLGIRHDRTAPGKPQQNGRHERMHRTLKAETTRPPGPDHKAQQEMFEAFRGEFNQERPHEALSYATPASLYSESPRPMPRSIPQPEYPPHAEVRLVSNTGEIKFKNRSFFLTTTLEGERVALLEVDDGIWDICFYNTLVARLNEHTNAIIP